MSIHSTSYSKAFSLAVFLALFSVTSYSQIVVSGIIADSVSLEPLAGTSVKLKHAGKGTTTNDKGFFTIISRTYDTLLISRVGYQPYEYALFGTEKDILILIREEATTLQEVVVDVYDDAKVEHSAPRQVKALTLGDAISSPFTYFSKEEKEKRMVVDYQKEQQKVQAYIDLVTRAQFRHSIMEEFSITEEKYYEILVSFNNDRQDVQQLKDELMIEKEIKAYFKHKLR